MAQFVPNFVVVTVFLQNTKLGRETSKFTAHTTPGSYSKWLEEIIDRTSLNFHNTVSNRHGTCWQKDSCKISKIKQFQIIIPTERKPLGASAETSVIQFSVTPFSVEQVDCSASVGPLFITSTAMDQTWSNNELLLT